MAIDIAMKVFHARLAMGEVLCLNDKNAVIGFFRLNPKSMNLAISKNLTTGPYPAKLDVVKTTYAFKSRMGQCPC